tara:strand:- start:199 stop:702 length:504 start_codon:yes stop_codon:yes gene_type:complete
MIEVYDDFFENEIQKEIFDRLIKPHWGIDGGTPNKPEIFWHYDGLEGPNHNGYFSEYIYEKICKNLDKDFKSVERIYANGQTAGQCGTPHYDDGDLTFLYYPNNEWNPNWQGHLIFFDKDGDEVSKIVEYKSNRAVLFPGTIKHYADAPSRFFNGLRISLAYKLWKE